MKNNFKSYVRKYRVVLLKFSIISALVIKNYHLKKISKIADIQIQKNNEASHKM